LGEGIGKVADPGSEGRYKELKKRMKADFKAIGENLATQTFPLDETLARFLGDAKEMMSYPEYGAPHYPDFRAACDRLAQAFDARDQKACQQACGELESLKKACHKRYK